MCAMKDTRIDIRIDTKTKKIVEEVASKNDSSVGDVIRWLIRNFSHLFKIGDKQ